MSECNIYFMVTPCISIIQHFIFPLMHTKLKNTELLKHFKIRKTAPTCFSLQGKPSSGCHSQYLAKITHLVHCGYIKLVQDVSVMAAYYDL